MDTTNITDADVDAAIRVWAKGALDCEAAAEIIIGTHLREHVVASYLDWDETHTMARPDLRRLLKDEKGGKARLSSSAYFLATLAVNLYGGTAAAPTDLRGLWNLDRSNRDVVVRALANALQVTSL